jgi:hypothetical protein
LFTVLQFSDLAVAMYQGLAYKNVKVKSSTSSRFRWYVSESKDLFTSDGKVLFCQPCRNSIAEQQRSQVREHLSESKHIAAVVGLQDRPGGQSHICESSATLYSSRPSKLATVTTSVQSICFHRHTTF